MVPKAKFAPLEVGSIPRQVNLFARIFPTWANLSRFFSLLIFAVQDCRITFTSNRVIRCEHFHNFYLLFILPEKVHLSEIMRQSDAWNLFLQMHDAQRRKKKLFATIENLATTHAPTCEWWRVRYSKPQNSRQSLSRCSDEELTNASRRNRRREKNKKIKRFAVRKATEENARRFVWQTHSTNARAHGKRAHSMNENVFNFPNGYRSSAWRTHGRHIFCFVVDSIINPFVCSLHVRRVVHNVGAGGRVSCRRYKTTANGVPFQANAGPHKTTDAKMDLGCIACSVGYIMCAVNKIETRIGSKWRRRLHGKVRSMSLLNFRAWGATECKWRWQWFRFRVKRARDIDDDTYVLYAAACGNE